MKKDGLIYLDTYLLQKDMRLRLPKSVVENFNVEKGITKFKIYYDKLNYQLVLRIDEASVREEK